jgi:hypothetical protein
LLNVGNVKDGRGDDSETGVGSLRFSTNPSELIQSSVILHEVVEDSKQKVGSKKKLFKTDHIRKKFRRKSIEELSDNSYEDFSENEIELESKERNKNGINRHNKQTNNPVKNVIKSNEPMSVPQNLMSSKTSFGNNQWSQDNLTSFSKNPFKNSEIQESLGQETKFIQGSLNDSSPQVRVFTKSQESAQTHSFDSLIHSNENALKNIIRAHDLKIEESFGKEQFDYYDKQNKKSIKSQFGKESREEVLEVIPEVNRQIHFKKKAKRSMKDDTDMGNEVYNKEEGRGIANDHDHVMEVEDDMRFYDQESFTNDEDSDVKYLMGKLAEVMESDPDNSIESSLIQHTNLNSKSKELLIFYFKKQDQKFQENKKYIDDTYLKLKEERKKIEDQLAKLGDGYKQKINQLEKDNKLKAKEIQKLKNKNKLLGIKTKKKPDNSKEKSKGEMTQKYYSEKIRNLTHILEEKNKKIKTLNSKIDDLKIDNQAMKELLHELSNKSHAS